jgi:hypothetical protein
MPFSQMPMAFSYRLLLMASMALPMVTDCAEMLDMISWMKMKRYNFLMKKLL